VKFPEDYNFWWRISIEEMNHAALIESINEVFLTDIILSPDSMEKQTDDVMRMNLYILEQIEKYRSQSPLRSEALKLAFELENSISEFHFQLFMTSKSDSMVMKVLQKLNGDAINHAKRIVDYMKDKGILL
jgi:hypothetical protein